jgi:hypothetical protein
MKQSNMIYRVQVCDRTTKRWRKLCDLRDRDLAEIALRRWAEYWIEYGRIEKLRIVEIVR